MDIKSQFLKQLKEIDQLQLKKGDYSITGSGPLAIRNLRAAVDVDILVTSAVWQELIKRYSPYDEKHIRIGQMEIWGDFINLTKRLEEVITSSEWIEGYPFVTLEETLSWKRFLNREKDQKDIALIESYLREEESNKALR